MSRDLKRLNIIDMDSQNESKHNMSYLRTVQSFLAAMLDDEPKSSNMVAKSKSELFVKNCSFSYKFADMIL